MDIFVKVFRQTEEWLILELAWNDKSATVSCIPNDFFFWRIEDLRIAQSYIKWLFSRIFCPWGPFPQDFEQVLAQILLCLIKIVRVCFKIECPMIFFCFVVEVGREECLNVWKMISFRLFSRLGSFRRVFGHVKKWIILE